MEWIVNNYYDLKQRQSDILTLIDEKESEIKKLKFEIQALHYLHNHFEVEVEEFEESKW